MLWWLSPGKSGGMPLHDAVGINCKKGATTENQGPDVKYMDWVCVISLDMTTFLGGGRKSLSIIIKTNNIVTECSYRTSDAIKLQIISIYVKILSRNTLHEY